VLVEHPLLLFGSVLVRAGSLYIGCHQRINVLNEMGFMDNADDVSSFSAQGEDYQQLVA
jgi:hypothetical protein